MRRIAFSGTLAAASLWQHTTGCCLAHGHAHAFGMLLTQETPCIR